MAYPNWLGDLADIYKSISRTYETRVVPSNKLTQTGHNQFSVGEPRTPKQVAADEGEGWKVGHWDDDGGQAFGGLGTVRIHRKK